MSDQVWDRAMRMSAERGCSLMDALAELGCSAGAGRAVSMTVPTPARDVPVEKPVGADSWTRLRPRVRLPYRDD